MIKSYCIESDTWLDLGCGHQLLPPWRYREEKKLMQKCKVVAGLDADLNSLRNHRTIKNRIRGDICVIPFANDSFDVITANMVFEHLQYPEIQLAEIYRVLKPRGRLIFHTPNIFGYTTIIARLMPNVIKARLAYLLENRKKEDVFPTYYKMNSKSRIEKLAQKGGFRVEKIRMILSSAEFAMIPPLVLIELIWIRILMGRRLRMLRTNIIAQLKKPQKVIHSD
ncbi:MAG: methyltransferase domain-containing protein [Deltaproteobacteria bacterium]|nr:methyltransferase domain-containing protein [Deltaproteobacteria bacterium]